MVMIQMILCAVAWYVPKLIVRRWRIWWVVLVAILAGWTVSAVAGIAIMAMEIPTLGFKAAINRFVAAFIVSLGFAIWSALRTFRSNPSTKLPIEDEVDLDQFRSRMR